MDDNVVHVETTCAQMLIRLRDHIPVGPTARARETLRPRSLARDLVAD